jgi:hypothetical protein
VRQFVDELGFDGVDAGSLDESWRQQRGVTDWFLRVENVLMLT